MQHGHAEVTILLTEALKIRGSENLSLVVEKIQPVYWLRLGHNRFVEPERTKGTKCIGAETETRTQRFQFARLLVNLGLPSEQPQALGHCKSGDACANDDRAHVHAPFRLCHAAKHFARPKCSRGNRRLTPSPISLEGRSAVWRTDALEL